MKKKFFYIAMVALVLAVLTACQPSTLLRARQTSQSLLMQRLVSCSSSLPQR